MSFDFGINGSHMIRSAFANSTDERIETSLATHLAILELLKTCPHLFFITKE